MSGTNNSASYVRCKLDHVANGSRLALQVKDRVAEKAA
jgi:hypothetical protein